MAAAFRVSTGIVGTVTAVSLLLLFVGISGAVYVHQLQTKTSQILDYNVASIQAAEELLLALRDTRYEIGQYMRSKDRQRLTQAELDYEIALERLKEAQSLARTQEEQIAIHAVAAKLGRIRQEIERLKNVPADQVDPVETQAFLDEFLMGEIVPPARDYLDLNEEELKRSSRENQTLAVRIALALLLLGTCGAISGMVIGYGIARSLQRKMLNLTVTVRDVAGQLNRAVGPISLSAEPGLDDLDALLQRVSMDVANVIEQLQQSHREVMRADQLAAVGQLAAGLAHELRNPLMCMKVLVQSARSEDGALEGRDLAVIEEEIKRLERLLQGFLDFARPASPERKPIDLRGVVEHTTGLLAPRVARRGIQIDYNAPAEPLFTHADEGQMRQVLLNLLLNSMDAVANDGWIGIELNREQYAQDGELKEELIMRVSDNGRGFAPEAKPRIFEPFFSTKETGLGLGLAMCQRMVQSHGGLIEAAERPEGGALFTVRLPALPQPESVPAIETHAAR